MDCSSSTVVGVLEFKHTYKLHILKFLEQKILEITVLNIPEHTRWPVFVDRKAKPQNNTLPGLNLTSKEV